MSKSVFCLCDTAGQAESIVDGLRATGFSNNDISVLFPDKSGTRDFAHEQHTKAPEGAATGAGAGGAVGGVLGWLRSEERRVGKEWRGRGGEERGRRRRRVE